MGKRYLLVTASVGSGHEKAAKAIADGIVNSQPEAQVDIVDFMRWDISAVNAFMKSAYLNMLFFVPNLYEFMYQFTAGKKKGGFIQMVMAKAMSRSIMRLIKSYRPDVIICTHPFPAEAVSHLPASWRKDFLAVAVITDYSVHQMWVCHNMNMYFVDCDSMKKQLINDGIDGEKVHVTGIPVNQQFLIRPDRSECQRNFQLEKNVPAVLMMGGGLGLGGMERAMEQIESLQDTIQLLVVAGHNKELLQQAQQYAKSSHHRIHIFGYTNEVRELMASADILITKPGALTLTEAMTMHLPMVLHEPIPGPETDNARYMSSCGAAVWLHAGDNLASVLQELLAEPETLREMAACAAKNSKPEAVQNILLNINATNCIK